MYIYVTNQLIGQIFDQTYVYICGQSDDWSNKNVLACAYMRMHACMNIHEAKEYVCMNMREERVYVFEHTLHQTPHLCMYMRKSMYVCMMILSLYEYT